MNLSACKIKNLDQIIEPIQKLKSLRALSLSHNEINDISLLSNLYDLKVLDLGNNELSDIYPIKELNNLTDLIIADNLISDITPLEQLVNLKTLIANNNSIVDIAAISNLSKLRTIDLDNNIITDISALKYLQKCNVIQISRNKIEDISPLRNLKKVKLLYLHQNDIKDISPLSQLINLKGLYCVKNKISDLSVLTTLINLEELFIGDNMIFDVLPLKHLVKLNNVYIPNNKIKDIAALKQLRQLKSLTLINNPIRELPEWITDLNLNIEWNNKTDDYEDRILLYNDTIVNPPIEIIKKGNEAIKRYFNKIKIEGKDFIFEAKLTFVGEGSAGKTSLQRRLLKSNASLPRKDNRTRGIEIKDWQFKKEKGKKHIAHIWDFGGQDVYYPVHRFFLTENSIFVLLASTRQNHHNFDYWIPTIYQFGGKSPIILGQTCHDGNKISWNDLGVYMSNSNFNIIKTQVRPYYEINLMNNNEGLEKIKQIIVSQITQLPHYGKGVPRSWVPVRNILREESKIIACISFDRFKSICLNSNPERFTNSSDIIDCCQFLHDIGVVLWYSMNEELKHWVILQPEWAMNAVYKIIDDEEIQKRRGNIHAKDFIRIWKESIYEDKHVILKKMLEIFKIAFPKRHKIGDYIIPARLLSMPIDRKWKDEEVCLRLEYRYEFMPRGMVNQISAELSRYIVSDNEVWNNAVNLSSENNSSQCQIEEDFYNRKIIIRSKGPDARGLIILTMDALKNITEGYKGVRPEIHVPCTCKLCMKNNKPTTFSYDKLIEWSFKRENAKVICNESQDSITINELLYNVGLPSPRINKISNMSTKTIAIFLASSSELKEDREQFEIFINRENKRLNQEGIFLNLELWEDFIDAMSKTRLQDEYNKVIASCDIFISLFKTKVGKFTAEEFETAFTQFHHNNKPLVYTYFKDEQINMSSIDKDDILSKFEFEAKLKGKGHFPTIYKNIEDLKYQFKIQLDKILPNL
ncbi:MAG: COR domain-containing protein [Bacteroidota bacterium]|nr:COR domain-containing protein [Bacteroidota bacterium]